MAKKNKVSKNKEFKAPFTASKAPTGAKRGRKPKVDNIEPLAADENKPSMETYVAEPEIPQVPEPSTDNTPEFTVSRNLLSEEEESVPDSISQDLPGSEEPFKNEGVVIDPEVSSQEPVKEVVFEESNPEQPVEVIQEQPGEKFVEQPHKAQVVAEKPAAPVYEDVKNIEDILNKPEIPDALKPVTATSPHADVMKLEKFIRMRKGPKPNVVYHMELMASGINMSNFGLLEGRVGKFKLKRNFISEAWTITID